ncbi:MAG: hypothetical protein ACYDG4_10635 [Desulfuromonadaceae bacterium]
MFWIPSWRVWITKGHVIEIPYDAFKSAKIPARLGVRVLVGCTEYKIYSRSFLKPLVYAHRLTLQGYASSWLHAIQEKVQGFKMTVYKYLRNCGMLVTKPYEMPTWRHIRLNGGNKQELYVVTRALSDLKLPWWEYEVVHIAKSYNEAQKYILEQIFKDSGYSWASHPYKAFLEVKMNRHLCRWN